MHVADLYQTKRISQIFTLFKELRVSEYPEQFCSYFHDIYTNLCVEAFPEEVLTYTPQSGALGTIQEEGVANLTEQITNFEEQDAGWTTKIGAGSDATMNLSSTSDASLGAFLGRPTRIAQLPWTVNQPTFVRIKPWELFLNDPRVAEKIANFELYRSKLHVKIVISGTGFHYGRALVSYNPLSGFDEITTERNFLSVDLIGASQKPHFFLNPTNNSGGQLDLPFFWPKNYLSLSSTDRADMGELVIDSFDTLQHANGGDDPVTITIYAWASEVVLTMPTSQTTLTAANYTPQSGAINSGDEYGKGIISAPASAIAHAAGKLKDVPTIGPYARATEMVAKGVGELATHWGYSRPPIVTDIVQQKPTPTGNMSNTDAADAVMKLSLDSKQELTIDSRTVGLDGEDQMDISRFVQRESYLNSFSMSPSEIPDTLLWNCRVTPNLYGVQADELHPTPMALMSQVFNQWQGTIKYRFQVVKSNFHKGKILLRWDPRAHSSTVQYNTVYSRVIDLAECDDFEICVGWGQADPFLLCDEMRTTDELFSSQNRLLNDNGGRYNGVLEVAVVNSLVSPSTDSAIQFNVFVSACEDMKFGEVRPATMKTYGLWKTPVVQQFTPQSGEVEVAAVTGVSEGKTDAPTNPDPIAPIAPTSALADQTLNVFFGESPKSIRELLRRYVLHRVDARLASPSNNTKLLKIRDKGLGLFPGWDPDGVDVVNGTNCNITVTTFAQWFAPCYAGWRGGTRTKYLFGGNTDGKPVVSRIGFSSAARYTEVLSNFTDAAEATKRLTYAGSSQTAGGAATTNIGINDTIEVEIPYYNGDRFATSRIPTQAVTNGCPSAQVETVLYSNAETATLLDNGAIIRSWKSVGEDFTFFFFTGCPILYKNEIAIPA